MLRLFSKLHGVTWAVRFRTTWPRRCLRNNRTITTISFPSSHLCRAADYKPPFHCSRAAAINSPATGSDASWTGYCNRTLNCLWPSFILCFLFLWPWRAIFPSVLIHEVVLNFFSCPRHLLLPWLFSPHGFCKHSREQYEKLSMMHKNMQKLYEGLGNFFAFDPHSVSMEDFFGDLANFRALFMVSTRWSHTEKPHFSPFTRAHAHKPQPPPTPHTLFYTYICSLTHIWCHRASGMC